MTISGQCIICREQNIVEFQGAADLPRVTSDCKPFPSGGRLAWCEICGTVQVVPDIKWQRDTSLIYEEYEIFHQSDGAEQAVYDTGAEAMIRRSDLLLRRLCQSTTLPRYGQLLDVGCGNGVTLSAFSRACPDWTLHGFDLDDRMLTRLRKIPGFVKLHAGRVNDVSDTFDLITMIHCLEHIPEPVAVLQGLLEKLSSGGKLFIDVPDASVWDYDLVIADHVVHFDLQTLAIAVESAGFKVTESSDAWSVKELSLIAERSRRPALGRRRTARSQDDVHRQLRWLWNVIEEAHHAAQTSYFGIFGTSVSAAWLFGSVGEQVEFFVDEDPERIGREFMGRPVLAPTDVESHATVFLALLPGVAKAIRIRLDGVAGNWILPPPK